MTKALLVVGAVAVAYTALALTIDRQALVAICLALAVTWATGAWLSLTRQAEADRRRHAAETARAAERTRIARELHDVVTHHVTAMVVQAEAARYLTASPDRLDETLTAITGSGRQSISDLRRSLDLLGTTRSPVAQPRPAHRVQLKPSSGGRAGPGSMARWTEAMPPEAARRRCRPDGRAR
ncbi:histidine kinase dimerization/phosphoacceptor domain-containing protein [Lentzea sp. E54]|uniref:histidine kinase dimerization/phosphoacceptor domain-containing protein n=1 Tax=Lentzea xerophila TaxID=3435883 RepID=UPI003DA4429C